jgi:hypothetical protein
MLNPARGIVSLGQSRSRPPIPAPRFFLNHSQRPVEGRPEVVGVARSNGVTQASSSGLEVAPSEPVPVCSALANRFFLFLLCLS